LDIDASHPEKNTLQGKEMTEDLSLTNTQPDTEATHELCSIERRMSIRYVTVSESVFLSMNLGKIFVICRRPDLQP